MSEAPATATRLPREELVYAVEARTIGSGKTIWHCEVYRRGENVPLVTSINLQSRIAAREEAERAIRRRYAA
jgi:hypothetical protein